MTTTDLDALTDNYAKTDSTLFPAAEKLLYYNIAQGILNALLSREQEDSNEVEETKTTVAGQSDYKEKARILRANWLKINYGQGLIPARYVSEDDLIARYGTEYESVVAAWPKSDPIYRYKGHHFFVNPPPAEGEAGANRLVVSLELLPEDMAEGGTPSLPVAWHYLLSVYAAWQYHKNNGETEAASLRQGEWNEGTVLMLETSFPRAKENEAVARIPNDDGSSY